MTNLEWNCWHEPCIPVRNAAGDELVLGIQDLFKQAHQLVDLSNRLDPLERESLYRFLISLGASIVQGLSHPETSAPPWPRDRFASHAVEQYGDAMGERFNLFGDKPFLQRWDKKTGDIEKLRHPKTELNSILLPIQQLYAHEPGDSSSKWAIRRDDRAADTLPELTVLLITAWFQTKNGNGKDPWKGPLTKGSAGTWHTNPLAIYYRHPTSLAKSLLANIPIDWIEDLQPLFFFDRSLPNSFAEGTLTRFTYAKSLPLLYRDATGVRGFVLGSDETVPIPQLGKDHKESLGLVHDGDHTRLYIETKAKTGAVTRKPRGSFGSRLSSTEGFERWFRAGNSVEGALRRWQARERILDPLDSPAEWLLALFSESTDGKGTRSWTSWDEMALRFGGATGETLTAIRALLGYATECRKSFYIRGRQATEAGDADAMISGQAAFFYGLAPLIATLELDAQRAVPMPLRKHAEDTCRIAIDTFRIATEPFMTPSRAPAAAAARALFTRDVRRNLDRLFPHVDDPSSKEELEGK